MRFSRGNNCRSESGFNWPFMVILLLVFAVIVFGARHKIKHEMKEFFTINKDEIENIVAEYIKENPKAIIDSVESWGRKQEEERIKLAAEKIKQVKSGAGNSPLTAFLGNANGDVTIIEFFDYRCGYCKKLHKESIEFLKQDKNAKIYLKQLPLLGPQSIDLAKLALAALSIDSKKFYDFHAALMETSQYDEASLDDMMKKAGLDIKKVREVAKEAKIQEEINSNRMLAGEAGISWIPALIFEEELVRDAMNVNVMLEKSKAIRQMKKGN